MVTTDELQRSRYDCHTVGFATELSKSVVNFDRINVNYDWWQHLAIDDQAYKNYVEKYVKLSGSQQKPIWEIVIDSIEADIRLNSL